MIIALNDGLDVNETIKTLFPRSVEKQRMAMEFWKDFITNINSGLQQGNRYSFRCVTQAL